MTDRAQVMGRGVWWVAVVMFITGVVAISVYTILSGDFATARLADAAKASKQTPFVQTVIVVVLLSAVVSYFISLPKWENNEDQHD